LIYIELGLLFFYIEFWGSYFAPGRAIFKDFKFLGQRIVFIKFTFFVWSLSKAYFYDVGVFFASLGFYNNYVAEGLKDGVTLKHKFIIYAKSSE
jgi:hypothetical protein